jgi:hypothetical protein
MFLFLSLIYFKVRGSVMITKKPWEAEGSPMADRSAMALPPFIKEGIKKESENAPFFRFFIEK